MIVTAREFTADASHETQHKHYAEVRKRLFGSVPKKEPAPVRAKINPPVRSSPRPLWSVVELHFDWHVMAWHEVVKHRLADLTHENAELMQENATLRAALQLHVPDMDYKPRRPVKLIVAEVLVNFPRISWADLKSHRRTRDIVRPRQICMYEIYKQRKDMSYPAIGRLFGGRDHTTVMHAVHKIEAELKSAGSPHGLDTVTEEERG